MTNLINPTINPYPQSLTGINNGSLTNVDADKVKQGINNSPVAKVADQKNPKLMFWVFLPTWLLTHLGMKKFSQACQGDYEKGGPLGKQSLLGKLDDLDKRLNKSKVIDNGFVKAIKSGSKKIISFLDTNIVNRNQILKALFHTPAVPENSNALMMLKGIRAAAQMFEKFTKNGTDMDKVRKLLPEMADKADDVVLREYQKIVKESHNYIDKIHDICKAQRSIVTDIESGGKIPWSKYFNKGKPLYLTDIFPNSEFVKNMFGKEIRFDEFANKMQGAKGGLTKITLRTIEGFTNATTAGGVIGSLMGAYIIADAIVRSINAPKGKGEKRKTFAENMLYNLGFYLTMPLAIKVMHGFGGLRYIGMKPEAVTEYRAMLKDLNNQVDANIYHTKLQVLNDKLSSNKITQGNYDLSLKALKEKFRNIDLEKTPTISKEIYNKRVKVLKRMKKGKTRIIKGDKALTNIGKFFKNIVHKPLKWFFDKIYMTGNEFAKPFVAKDASKFTEVIKKIQFKAKDFSAYPVRMIAFMFLFAPFFAKFFAKGSHLVFGKPAKSILDEGKEEKEKEKAEKLAKAQQAQQTQMAASTVQKSGNLIAAATVGNVVQNQSAPVKKENLIDIYKTKPNSQVAMTSYVPSSQGMIPSDEGKPIKKENLLDMYKSDGAGKKEMIAPAEPVRTYIPSVQSVKIPPGSDKDLFDKEIPELNHAVTKAERAEKEARKYVK